MLLNPYRFGGGGGGPDLLHWNPADKSSEVALSTDLKTMWHATGSAGHQMVRSYVSRSTGKRYVEFKTTASRGSNNDGSGMVGGFITGATSLTGYPGFVNNTVGFQFLRYNSSGDSVYMYLNGSGFNTSADATTSSPAWLGVAIDFANNQIWANLNGTWLGGLTPQGSPSTGFTTMNTGLTLFPAASCSYPITTFPLPDNAQTLQTLQAEMSIGVAAFGAGQPLDGFSGWSD